MRTTLRLLGMCWLALLTASAVSAGAAGDPYKYLKTLPPSSPTFAVAGVAIDPASHFYYVADRSNDRIRVYNQSGDFVTAFGSTGTGDGQFQGPYYVALDPVRRRLFVTDKLNFRVQIFDVSGSPTQIGLVGAPFVGQIRVYRTGSGQPAWVSGVAADPLTGNVAVVADRSQVRVFGPDGMLQRAFSSNVIGADGLAFDASSGKYYVVDSYHPQGMFDSSPTIARVLVFDSSGNYLSKFGEGQLHYPLDVAVDPATHELLVSDGGRVVIFDAGGTLRGQFGREFAGTSDPFYDSIAVDPATHDVVVTDIRGQRSMMFSANVVRSGKVVEYVDTIDFPESPGGHFFYTVEGTPEAATVDSGAVGAWKRTGSSFGIGGTIPVCRFYGSPHPGPNSHFYTIDSAECSAVSASQDFPRPGGTPQWNFEGLSFTESPPQGSGDGARCSADQVPVYRAYNNAYQNGVKNPWDSNHRFSTDLSSIQSLVANFGWTNEGIKMCAPQ